MTAIERPLPTYPPAAKRDTITPMNVATQSDGLAAKIARLVEERGWNQEDFARITKLNRQTIRQILLNHGRKPHNATVLACAKALGLTVAELRSVPIDRLLPRMQGHAPADGDENLRRLYGQASQPELRSWLERNPDRARQLTPAEIDELLELQENGSNAAGDWSSKCGQSRGRSTSNCWSRWSGWCTRRFNRRGCDFRLLRPQSPFATRRRLELVFLAVEHVGRDQRHSGPRVEGLILAGHEVAKAEPTAGLGDPIDCDRERERVDRARRYALPEFVHQLITIAIMESQLIPGEWIVPSRKTQVRR
jgi:transcriptional regulator with XRE-family HTH domain